ncbi:hypothetical protein CAPTEDRAFT_205673 [Capitella teleta]|uniref:Chloride channel protein n=1 Tax=Capitella teleta TaxID=283909 RepID=R7T9J3_CAPTE|nr:hypothetical protein CAPTEDRAFT_205673 [Capitella teleta]|eukprot:ELT90364.1 hypothetical protein CAPTEDRAFT_205673 [Capitella teleta]
MDSITGRKRRGSLATLAGSYQAVPTEEDMFTNGNAVHAGRRPSMWNGTQADEPTSPQFSICRVPPIPSNSKVASLDTINETENGDANVTMSDQPEMPQQEMLQPIGTLPATAVSKSAEVMLDIDEDDEAVGGLHREPPINISRARRMSVRPISFVSKSTDKSIFARSLASLATKAATQNFSEQEREALSKFSSLNYAPTHSLRYMTWLKNYATGGYLQLERWFLCLLIGVSTGLLASLLKQCTGALGRVKWQSTTEYISENQLVQAWGWNIGLSLVYVFISSFLVVFIHPVAAGGGTPEIIAYLNGVMVHGALGLKNLVVKFCSLVFSVSSGLAVGTQGPLISYGAIIGAGVGQFQSKTLGFKPNIFTRFRTPEDRREFTTAGVAAGVAAGFNAPVGGLLFAMEDLSSFWGKRLSWQTFFTAIVATATAQLFNTALIGFEYQSRFGLFSLSVVEPIHMHFVSFVPAVILGVIGGLLGAFFTRMNTFLNRQRKLGLSLIKNDYTKKMVRILECLALSFLMASYSTYLPGGFSCKELNPINSTSRLLTECTLGKNHTGQPVKEYNCMYWRDENATQNNLYNDVATIVQGGGSAYLDHLWSTGTHERYTWYGCLAIFVIWFIVATYTPGTAVAGGIFLPVVIGGALYGRALGIGMVSVWQQVTGSSGLPIDTEWDWMDPGIVAVMGSASLLGGVTRLALATTVIMVEMSGDIDLAIPVMITIFVAKMVADTISKPLFMYQLDAKLLPFLAQEPTVVVQNAIVNLELYKACDVMASPVWTIHSQETVQTLAKLLIETDHEGFPVVKQDPVTKSELYYGLITRTELYVILCSKSVYDETKPGNCISPKIDYDELSVDYIPDPSAALEIVKSYNRFPVYQFIHVDLEPFINMSSPKIDEDYSLHRTYQLFRTLGLRHLTVTDIRNRVVGMITRKDLMPYKMQEKLAIVSTVEASNNNNADEKDKERRESDGEIIMHPAITLDVKHDLTSDEESEGGIEIVVADNNTPL